MLQPGSRFAISTINGQLSYKIEMKLVITDLRENDFGLYKCIAKNPRGTTDGSITLTGAFNGYIRTSGRYMTIYY